MRILHLGKFYSPIEGGIETINSIIVTALDSHIQKVLSFNNKSRTEVDIVDNAEIIRCSTMMTLTSQPISISYYFRLKKEIQQFRPDVIHLHYPNPLVAFYLLLLIPNNCKLIVHWHSDIVAQSKLYRLIKPIENKLLMRADVIIGTSPNYVNSSAPLQQYVEKIKVIPCSINETALNLKLSDEELIKKIKSDFKGKPIIFFLGRHVEYKGIEFLLKSIDYIQSDCTIVIAGQGPLTNQLKGQYKTDKIHWIGKISDEQKRLYMHAASILAFPSITKNEAFGIALAEGMYCGCVPITFTIPGSGVNWVSIANETGIEVHNKDYVQFAKAIDFLLCNHTNYIKFQAQAHRRANDLFTTKAVIHQYQQLYMGLV